jgi:hypothetical protein
MQQDMHTASYEEQMTAGQPSSRAGEARRTQLEVSVSIRTILLIAGVVAVAWALASIASVLLVIFVSLFSIAVLSPVVSAMERRLRWSRRLSSAVLVLAIVIVLGAVALVVVQAIVGAVREFSDDLPRIVDEVRRSELGSFIDSGSDSLDTLAQHAGEITSGVAKVSGGVADVGLSAFGAVTLVLSVMFLTLFGLIDEPRLREWIGGLLYRGDRERFLKVTDRIVQTTSRYRGDHRRPDRGRNPDRREGAHCRQESSHRRRGHSRVEAFSPRHGFVDCGGWRRPSSSKCRWARATSTRSTPPPGTSFSTGGSSRR